MNKLIVGCASCMMTVTSLAATFNGSKDSNFGDADNWDTFPVAGDSIEIADGVTAVVDGSSSMQTELLSSLVGAKVGEGSVLRVLNYPDTQTFTLAAGKLALTGTGSFEFVCDSTDDTVVHGVLSIASDNSAFAGSFRFINVPVTVNSLTALGSGCPIYHDVPALTQSGRQPFTYLVAGVYNHPLTVKNTRNWFAIWAAGCAVTNNGALVVDEGCSRPVRINGQNAGSYYAQAGEITVKSNQLMLNGHIGLPGTAKMTFVGTTFVSAASPGDQIDYGKREIVATVGDAEGNYRPLRINRGHWKLLEDDALKDVSFSFGYGDAGNAVWLDLNGHSTVLSYTGSGWLAGRMLKVLKGSKYITSSAGPATAAINVAVSGYDGGSESTFTWGRLMDVVLGGSVTMKTSFPATGITDGTWHTGYTCPDGVNSSTRGSILSAKGTVRLLAKSRYENLNKLEVTGNDGNFWVIGTPTLGAHTALIMSRSSTDTTRANGYVRIDADQTLTVATASDAGTPLAAGEYTKDNLPNVLAPAGTGTLIVTGTPTITAADVLDEKCVIDGTGFLSSTVLTISAAELAKVPRRQGETYLRYKIAEKVSTMPALCPALASTPGWSVQLTDGSIFLQATSKGMFVVVH